MLARLRRPAAFIALALIAATATVGTAIGAGILGTGSPRPGSIDAIPTVESLSPQDREQKLLPGAVWDGIGRGDMTQADLEAFSDFPVWWVGTSWHGFNLQKIVRVKADVPPGVDPIQAEDSITFLYGFCGGTDQGFETCPWPVQITVHRLCAVPLDAVSPAVKAASDPVTYRGVPMQTTTAHGRIMLSFSLAQQAATRQTDSK